MRLFLSSILFVLMFSLHAQQLEVGPSLAYGAVNISDSKSDEDKTVIGDGLWDFAYSANVVFYPTSPDFNKAVGGIGLLYRHTSRGAVSETDGAVRFFIPSNTYGIYGRLLGTAATNFSFVMDVGLAINRLDTTGFFEGSIPHTEAFPRLSKNLVIQDTETNFIYTLGCEITVLNEKCRLSIGIIGDASISKLNANNRSSAYRTQSAWMELGLKYILIRKQASTK